MSQTEGESAITASFLKPEDGEPQQDFVQQKQKAAETAEEPAFDEAPDDDPDDRDSDYLSVKRDVTMRAIFLGLIIGTLVGAMNVNFGLKTGWTQGGSIFTAILSIGIFRVINPSEEYTKYETVITTTTASAVGSMASASGLVSYFPALKLLGRNYSVWELYLWAIGVAYIGIFFAFPLRKTMIVHEKLRFPSGTVTAETIKNMFAKGAETVQKAKSLLYTAAVTALFSLAAFFVPYIEEPPMPAIVRQWGWNLNLDPLLFGGGMLSGFRASSSMMLGAVVGWGILGPIVQSQGWVTGKPMTYQGVRGWILWIGVAIMTADSFVQLLFSIGYAIKGLFTALINRTKKQGHSYSNLNASQEDEERPLPPTKKPTRVLPAWVPWYWWAIGLTVSCFTLMLVGQFIFDLKWYFVLLAFPISLMLSIIAVRCSGETDINPVGSMGKVTQLIYAGIAPRQIPTNLLSAGIVAAGAAQCGDMMQDLKTGYLLKVAPRSQFVAQMIGIMFGIVFCIPIYKLYDTAYHIGGEEIPAPAAHAWKAVAEVLSQGFSALPLNSGWGMLAGAILGILLGFLSKTVALKSEKVASFIPSALAFGMGMIVPAKQSVTMFLGSVVLLIWQRVGPQHCKRYFFTISSGLIAGEGLMGIFVAILKLIGVKPLFELPDDM